jgi:PBSX family phage terminase large subunit
MSDGKVELEKSAYDPTKDPRNRPYKPQGHLISLFYDRSDQLLLCGPSGTGKSRGILEKMHIISCKYPGARSAIVRKVKASLTQTAMVTYEKFVLPENNEVHWRTGEQEYRYNNGSVVVTGGMDKSIKVMSSEYDLIYVQEATELLEDDWETLTTRNRYGVVPYQQLIGDCNPNTPTHWLKAKVDKGDIKILNTTHEDNPILWDENKQEWTPRGIAYIAKLDKLTGVRYKRLRLGLWASAEGMIYDMWDPIIHMVDEFRVPDEWPRYWVVDFGYTNPFVWQCWARDKEHEVSYRIAEIYKTRTLVEDHCQTIKAWLQEKHEFRPAAIICDHDAEDRATFERHMGIDTVPAVKNVQAGIQNVMSLLKSKNDEGSDDHRPGLMFMRNALLDADPELQEAMLPTCTEDEIDGYEWEDAKKKETPRKKDDHGCDDVRYYASHIVDDTDNWVY